jgi:hypothetical protein
MINSLFGFSLIVHLSVIGWYRVKYWLYPSHEYQVVRHNGLPIQILSGAIVVAVFLIISSVSLNILRTSIDSEYFSMTLLAHAAPQIMAYADDALGETMPATAMTASSLASVAGQHEALVTLAVIVSASTLIVMLVSGNPFLSELFFRGRRPKPRSV